MKEKIEIHDLTLGMFVAELDRPWLDTPFLIQGFVIESQEQIQELQQHCQFVFVERTLSVGNAFRPDPEQAAAKPQRAAAGPRVVQKNTEAAPGDGKESFFAMMRRVFGAAFGAKPEATAAEEAPVPATPRITSAGNSAPRKVEPRNQRREKGISSEEHAHLQPQPEAGGGGGLIVHNEAAGGGFWARLLRMFGGKSKSARHSSYIGEPETMAPPYPDRTTFEEELPKAREAHQKANALVQDLITDLRNNKVLELEKAHDAVNWMVESVVRNPDGLMWLARLKDRDAYTYDHGLNTSIYLIAFGRHLGLRQDQLQNVGTAGLMQDVGKIRLPQELIAKPGKLTAAEFKVMKSHVEHSVEIIQDSKQASQLLVDVVLQHHERYNGSGYPKGLKGDQISMLGSMAGIADTYTAMISARAHASPLSVQQALQQLYAWRDQSFKAEMIEEFIQCIGIFPVGSLVELNTGEVAVVVAQNRERRLKPRIMLVLDNQQQPYTNPIMLDLLYDPPTPAGEPYRIVRGLQAGIHDYDPQAHLDAISELSGIPTPA
jgi:HD-GYP domain-containing protein (c-di-GMP phosphodiesterase class II)